MRGRLWWTPFAFVVLSLALLFGTPIIIARRIRRTAATIDDWRRARVLVNDIEAFAATETILTRPSLLEGSALTAVTADSLARATARKAAADERDLDSLVARSDPRSSADVRTIAQLERTLRPTAHGAPDIHVARPLALIGLAEALDTRYAQRVDSARASTRRDQELDVTSAAILAPLAFFAALAVLFAAQRSRVLADRLRREHAALARSLEERSVIMRGLTHDLGNPLGAASGYTHLLLDAVSTEPLTPSQSEMVRRIGKLLSESADTISALLRAARTDSNGAMVLNERRVDVGQLVVDTVGDFRALAAQQHLSLTFQKPPNDLVIRTDADRLRHILENLLSNAIKYTPAGGRVRVSCQNHQASQHAVRIEVADSGPGIPAELRERVFDEFFRVNPEAGPSGHGVGLAISRRFARRLGGDLNVAQAPEGGALFLLDLPANG